MFKRNYITSILSLVLALAFLLNAYPVGAGNSLVQEMAEHSVGISGGAPPSFHAAQGSEPHTSGDAAHVCPCHLAHSFALSRGIFHRLANPAQVAAPWPAFYAALFSADLKGLKRPPRRA